MKLTLLAVGTSCALIVMGCNRETTDQGGIGQDPAMGTRQDSVTELDRPPQQDRVEQPPDADNTGRNVRDRSGAALTPGDQGGDRSDVELTRQIRQVIALNDQFSVSAENIKIITANGRVTLRGPVRSAAERDQIVQIVQGHAGVIAVDNQLEVIQDQ
jgi:hyperosmotically inducible periplasmic protein